MVLLSSPGPISDGAPAARCGKGHPPRCRVPSRSVAVTTPSHVAIATEVRRAPRARPLRIRRNIPAVEPREVVDALAIMIALEDRDTAERIAGRLPEFLDELDAVRASDGAMQLAQVLDRRRRAAEAALRADA